MKTLNETAIDQERPSTVVRVLNGLAGASAKEPPLPLGSSLKTLPLHAAGAMRKERMLDRQRVELDARGSFVSAYRACGGRDGCGQKLDPVLAFHLGVEEETA